MRRLCVLVIPVILLAGLVLFRLSDTSISVADTDTLNNEVTSAGNSSASATITITMDAVADEYCSRRPHGAESQCDGVKSNDIVKEVKV